MKTQLSKPKPNPRPSKLRKSFKFKAKSQFGVCKEHNREIELRKLIIQQLRIDALIVRGYI